MTITACKIKLPTISAFGLVSVLIFIFSSFIARILFPFGDEPDFSVRAPRIVEYDHPWWSPYFFLKDLLSGISYKASCEIFSSPFSFWAHIDFSTCSEDLWQSFLRLLITLFVLSPLLYAAVFRRSFISLMGFLKLKLSLAEWTLRLDAISISLVFSGMFYSLGVLSEEQFTLLLSLLIFLVWGSSILVVALIAMIMTIDVGNTIIVITFVLSALLYTKLANTFSVRLLCVIMVFQVLVVFFWSNSILELASKIPFLAERVGSIMSAYSGYAHEAVEKYPVILRPIITYMSFIFLTPAYVKIPLAYLFVGFGFLLTLIKVFNRYKHSKWLVTTQKYDYKYKITIAISGVSTILFFVFLLPTYANAKYYMFLLPYFICFALLVYSREKILIFFVVNILIVFSSLILYRL